MNIKEHLNKAYETMQKGDLKSALILYNEVLSADPSNLNALNSLGFLFYFLEEYEQGKEVCLKTINLYPNNPYARKGLGLHLARLNCLEEAVQSLKKAIEIDENFVDAYHDLAFVYFEAGDFDTAKKYLVEGMPKIKDEKYQAYFDKFMKKLDEINADKK